MNERCELRLPDLGLESVRIVVSVWLVELGAEVIEGDRLLQVVAGEISVDLPAPASGCLVEQCVVECDEVQTGQLLGVIER
jgi:pyruvate/2-oxoglutarate dehydrogenase complex dihydrolipoamide acyltransferase (E2) component